jgi:hypothetical protein
MGENGEVLTGHDLAAVEAVALKPANNLVGRTDSLRPGPSLCINSRQIPPVFVQWMAAG